jgi:hypothetical protein
MKPEDVRVSLGAVAPHENLKLASHLEWIADGVRGLASEFRMVERALGDDAELRDYVFRSLRRAEALAEAIEAVAMAKEAEE